MFNFSGSEIVFLLLIALVVLGPEKLPEAVRKFGKTYGEFKKVSGGFQRELRSALDEPMREMRETADVLRKAATFDLTGGDTPAPSEQALVSRIPHAEEAPPAEPEPASEPESAVEGAADTAADAPRSRAADLPLDHPDHPGAAGTA